MWVGGGKSDYGVSRRIENPRDATVNRAVFESLPMSDFKVKNQKKKNLFEIPFKFEIRTIRPVPRFSCDS